jgi:TonB family protein
VLKRKVPDPLTKRVIAEENKPDSAFLVAQPAPEPAIDMSSDPSAVREGTEQGSGAAANKADAEQVRLAQQREADQRRAEVQLAQQRDSEMRRQREVEEQARLTQQREAEVRRQQQAEEQARMARQRDEEVLRQQQAEEQARLAQQRTEELRRQRQADELAARQRAEQEQRQAELQKRAAEQLAARRTAQAADVPAPATAGPSGVAQSGGLPGGAGSGNGNGAVPRPVSGSDLASRARDMLRGIDVLKGSPPSREAGADPQQARRLIFGSAEREVQVRLYIDSFRQKIERNGTLNGAQLPGDRVRIDPVVSVAIRSDGSVEDVLIVRSSGHSGLDAAVRRIVRVNARYSAFPPNVAARYDVIEIRRIWTFADGLRLLEEVH